MKMHDHKDAVHELLKSAPPVAVTGMTFMGVPLQQWVYWLTLIWLAMQICGFVYDRFIKAREEK